MALDLTRSRVAGPLIRNPLAQRLTAWGLVFSLGALIALGWGRERLPGIPDAYPLLYTHATTLLFWVVWFMGLVLLAPLFGRAWCGVCPQGLLSDRAGRVGLNLPWPTGAARWIWMLALFAAGVTAALFFDAHKSPHVTALLVAGILLLSISVSLVWRRAAFCRLVCPVGLVLAAYGRFAPLRVAPRDGEKCSACATKSCVARSSSWKRWDWGNLVLHKKIYGSGCPVALDPPTMDAAECLLCMECVRRCPDGNLGVFYGRRVSTRPLSAGATALLVPLAGLVLLALVRTWPGLRDGMTPMAHPPVWAWGLWFGLVLPSLALLLPSLVEWTRLSSAGRDEPPPAEGSPPPSLKKRGEIKFLALAGRVASPMAGPVLGAHLALALVKLNAKAAYVPYLFYDPMGAATYMAVHVAGTLPQPGLIVPLSVLGPAALALMGIGTTMGLRDALAVWKAPLGPAARALAWLSFSALTALYAAILIHWLFPGR